MQTKTKRITYCAVLIALGVLLKAYLKISFGDFLVLSLAPIVVMLSGVLLGPVLGGITGALTDFLAAIIAPIGAYFPGYTLSMAMYGILPGLIVKKNPASFGRIALAVALAQITSSFLLNNLWLSVLTGLTFDQLWWRIITSSICMGIYIVAVYLLNKMLPVQVRKPASV